MQQDRLYANNSNKDRADIADTQTKIHYMYIPSVNIVCVKMQTVHCTFPLLGFVLSLKKEEEEEEDCEEREEEEKKRS